DSTGLGATCCSERARVAGAPTMPPGSRRTRAPPWTHPRRAAAAVKSALYRWTAGCTLHRGRTMTAPRFPLPRRWPLVAMGSAWAVLGLVALVMAGHLTGVTAALAIAGAVALGAVTATESRRISGQLDASEGKARAALAAQ